MADKETKILEMQFENRKFEKNIAKSKNSVEDLKKTMNFDAVSEGLKKFSTGLGNLTDKIDFSKLSNNIQKLTDKFTGLGTLSELILSQIRRGIEQTAARISSFVNSMTTAQVSAGMSKFEMLNKSVQTIKAATGKDEKDVYTVLERLNKYTDQTSYNFADMAQNIGKFTSVGIELEDAEKQMEGIANWAARSGAGINEASRAMYNLSQAMGVGKLTLIDWKSIENAGMATQEFKQQLIDSAVAAGTLKATTKKVGDQIQTVYKTAKGGMEVTTKNVGSTLNKGWATSEVLSKTLEKYYYGDLYYELEEALDKSGFIDPKTWETLKDAGTITDDVKKELIALGIEQGKLTEATSKDGKKIYKTVSETGEQIEFTMDTLEESLNGKWLDKGVVKASKSLNGLSKSSYEAAQKCQTFSDVLGAWRDQISTGWMNSFKIIFGELSEAMEFFSDVCNKVGESLDELITFRNQILQGWRDNGGRDSLITALIGSSDTEEEAFGFLDILNSVKDMLHAGLADFFSLFTNDPVMKQMMHDDPQYLSAWLGYQAAQISDKVKSFMQSIKDFFNEEVTVGGKTQTRLELVQEVIAGIAGALKMGYDLVTGVITFISEIGGNLSPGFDKLLAFFGDLGQAIFNTAEDTGEGNKIQKFFQDLAADLKPTTDSLNELIGSIVELARAILGLEEGSEENSFADTLSKIAGVIRKVAGVVNKVATPVIKFLTNFVNAITKLFNSGINGESLKTFASDLGGAFGEMMNGFADALPKSLGFLSDWIHNLFGGGKKELEGEATSLFGKVKEVIGKGKQVNKEANAEGEKSQGTGIMSLLTGSNIAVWVGVAALASVVLLLRKARKVVGSIGVFFGDLGDALKNGFKIKFQDESFATKFLKIGAAIALVAASIFALGSMPLNSLIQGGIAIMAVVGIMFGLFKLLEMSAKKGEYKDQLAFAAQVAALALGMMALSAAIGVLTLALLPFTLMSWDQYAKAMAGLGGILLQMVGFMTLLKVLKIDNVKIAGLAGFAIGLGLLVQGLTPFAKMSWDQYARVMAGLGGILLEIVGFMELFKVLGLSTKALKFDGIVKFTFALALLVFAIKPFAKMSWEQYARVMAGLGGVLLEIVGFMELFKVLGLSTKALNFNGIIKFTLALAILVFAIKPFASMSWEQYARVMAGLGGVLLEILAFMELFKVLGLSTKALNFDGIIKFTLALAILVFAIKPFANMSWEQYARVMAGLGGVLLEIIGFMELFKVLGLSTKALKFAGFLMFVIGLTMLINALNPFTQMSWEQYAKAMAGLGGTLLILAGFLALLKVIKPDSVAVAGLMGLVAALSALVRAISPFTEIDWGQYAVAMASLATILGLMLLFVLAMNTIDPDIKSMAKLAVFVGIVAAIAGIFAGVLHLVKDIDWKTIAAFSAGLALLVAVIAAAGIVAGIIGLKGFAVLAAGLVLVLGAIALMAPMLIKAISGGLRDAAADLAIMGDLMATFSGKMDGVSEEGINKAGKMIEKMMGLFGMMVGFRMTEKDTREFMTAMSRMVLAMDELVTFEDRIKKLSNDGGAGKATEIIAGIRKMFDEQLKDFGSYYTDAETFYSVIYKLGSGFDYFNSMSSRIGDPNDNNGLALIQALSDMAPNIDTIYKMDLGHLQDQLAGLGGAMILYAQGAEEVNKAEGGEITEETDVSGAITLLNKLTTALAENGGFTIPSNMPDEGALRGFGVELAALAGALVAFEKAGAGLGTGTEQALATLDFFADLKAKLLSMETFGADLSGAINSFKDENGKLIQKDELTKFGEDIAQLGSSMAHFAESTQYIDQKTGEVKPIDFTKATDALTAIVNLQTLLPATGGVLQVITGTRDDLGKLSEQVNLLGTAIKEFHDKTGEVNARTGKYTAFNFDNVTKFLEAIGDVSTKLPKFGGIDSWIWGDDMKLSELGVQLEQLGSGLNIMSSKLTGDGDPTKAFDAEKGKAATDLLTKHIVPFMQTLQTNMPTVGGLGNIIGSIIGGRNMNLTDLGTQLAGLGTGLAGLGKGLNDGQWGAIQAEGISAAFSAIDSVLGIMVKLNQLTEADGTTNLGSLSTFVQGLTESIMVTNDTGSGLTGLHSPIIDRIVSFIGYLSSSLDEMSDTAEEAETITKQMEIFKLFAEGLNALTSVDISYDWTILGKKMTTGIATGIITGTDSVTTAMANMMTGAWEKGDKASNWSTLGLNIVTGIAAGINDNKEEELFPVVEQMMRTAYERGKQAIDSNSPSKLFMELGEFMGEGTAIGLQKTTGEVGENAGELGEVALDKVRAMVALVSTVLAEEMNAHPVIAPVLDLTDMQAGMAQMNSELAKYNLNMGMANLATATFSQLSGSAFAGLEPKDPDYSGIYTRMERLEGRIEQMGKSIQQMKIVLNTGALVGGLADGIDYELGRRGFFEARNN